jgi:hypothetical protein
MNAINIGASICISWLYKLQDGQWRLAPHSHSGTKMYSSISVFRHIYKPWVKNITTADRTLAENPQGKKLVERSIRRLEDIIKLDLREM